MAKTITQKQELDLRQLYLNGCTDSDIEDYCTEHHISRGAAFHLIAVWDAPNCCKKCKHVEFFSSMYPCSVCCRPLKDMYEEEEGE